MERRFVGVEGDFSDMFSVAETASSTACDVGTYKNDIRKTNFRGQFKAF